MPIVDREVIGEEISSHGCTIPNLSIGNFIESVFRKNVEEKGDSRWLTDVSTGKSMTYSQLLTSMKSVASGLHKRGFKPGDSCVVISSNFIELPLMSFSLWQAGGVPACLGVNLPKNVIHMRMREIGNKFVLTDYERAERIVEVVEGLDFVKEVFVIGDKLVHGCTPFNRLLQDSGDECPEHQDDNIDLNSTAWLAYSSGTTGLAKCIVHTHRSIVGSFYNRNIIADKSGYKYLFVNPLNNTGGFWICMMSTSLAHFELFCMSGFNEEKLISAIDQVKPQELSLFPAHVAWMCRYPHLDRYDLSSVTSILVMGSTTNSIYERKIFEKLPNLLFFDNIYGMSEIGLVCLHPRVDPSGLDKEKAIARHVFGSVGKILPYCKIKVVDGTEKLGPNEIGEIYVHSPFPLREYLNRPKEFADFIRDGWAHTGDKGYYDENGYVYVIGRYKELIKYRNMHVVPTDIEKIMMTHPAIQDVGVVGLADDVDGERPLAFVVLTPGQNATADELIAFTNEKVMDEEKLRGGIRFIDKIPRNDLGKIVRLELMDLLHAH